MARKDLNSPRRELSNGGLESFVTLLVAFQIDYSCAPTGKAIQLYIRLFNIWALTMVSVLSGFFGGQVGCRTNNIFAQEVGGGLNMFIV